MSETPERFEDLDVPDEAKPFVLDFSWSIERLRALPLETVELPVAALVACLSAPLWRREGRPFTLRPRDVLNDPTLDPDHYERTLQADLSEAVYVTRRDGRWLVLDGVHRLAKARKLGYDHVKAKVVPAPLLERIRA